MSRAFTLSLHEKGLIKVLSTIGYTLKRIADVVKRSRKAIMNFLCHQEEHGTKKSSGRPSKLNGREIKEILRTASNNTISIVGIRVSFTFQQDNATIHVSRSTNTWLEDNDVGTTDWPSRSPDLNPMEDL
uniref:HTH_Tnp_Tc3_1 domain-containing protein n=1 Tax=Heterorhabditis bacteriophora TaxID=37862 RepID=A0A1I7XF61_HETBA